MRRLQLLPALWEALRAAGEDAPATVLSVALHKARARSVMLWGERHTGAMTAAFDAEEVSALEVLVARRAVEESLWDLTGGPNSASFSPTHDPKWVRDGEPLQFFHSYKFNLLAVDGNCATFPLCAYEAHLPQTLEQGVDEGFDGSVRRLRAEREEVSADDLPPHRILPKFECFLVLVADDEAFIALDPTAHERRIAVLPATLRASLHAAPPDLDDPHVFDSGKLHVSQFDPDTTPPPGGVWAPRPGKRERSLLTTYWFESTGSSR